MRSRVPLVLLLLLVSLAAHAQLGGARRLLPPRHGVIPYVGFSWGAVAQTDGANFLVTLHTATPASDRYPMSQMVLLAPDGTQLTDPVPQPQWFSLLGAPGRYLFFRGTTTSVQYLRVGADGRFLDAEPRTVGTLRGLRHRVAGSRAVFLIDMHGTGALLDWNGGLTPVAGIPPVGQIVAVAAWEHEFAVSYKVGNGYRVRVFNDGGATMRHEELGTSAFVLSDGASWLLVPNDPVSPYRLVDRDFVTTRTLYRERNQTFHPIPGTRRAYMTVMTLSGRPTLTEFRAPGYVPDALTPPAHSMSYPQLTGTPEALFAVVGLESQTAHILPSVAQWSPSIPPISFRGALDRERPSGTTNAAGVSLVAWSEAPGRLYAARVSQGGVLLDAEPMLLTEECREVRSSVATDGSDFLVGWSGCGAAGAAFVSAGGTVMQGFRRPKSYRASNHALSLAFAGQSYLMSWSDGVATRVLRVLRDGSAVSPGALIEVTKAQVAPAKDGNALMVYTDATLRRMASRRLTRDFQWMGPEVPLTFTEPAEARTLNRVGDRFLLTSLYTNRTFPDAPPLPVAIWLDRNGAPEPTGGGPVGIGSIDHRLHCTVEECTLLWKTSSDGGEPEIWASAVGSDSSGRLKLGRSVRLAAYEPGYPYGEAILFSGTVAQPSLVLYTAPDPEHGGLQIFARTSLQKRRTARP